MKFTQHIAATIFLVATLNTVADVSSTGAVNTTPITIALDDARAFPFPKNILGAQDEIFTLPYIYQSQLQAYKNTGMSMLRYPCGTPSDWLAWDDVEGSYWPSDFEKKRNKLTPDAYVDLCKSMQWDTLITVNTTLAGSHNQRNRINPTKVSSIRKGAQYAAEWVRHANIKNKSGVKYWEIGNEVWIWMKETEYPVHVREYSRAMRKIDPSIKIIACGSMHNIEFNPTWLQFPDDPTWKPRPTNLTHGEHWTKNLLTMAKGDFDYLAPHIYIDGASIDPIANGSSLFAQIDDGEQLIQQQINWIKQANSPVRLALTEWMINWHYCPDIKDTLLANKSISKEDYDKLDWPTSPMLSFISVLGSADWLGKMIATGYVDIGIAHTMTFGVAAIWDPPHAKPIDPALLKPAGVAMQFWNACVGQNVIPVKLNHVPTYQNTHRLVPMISVYATADANTLNLIMINRTPNEKLDLELPTSFKGRRIVKITEHAVSAKSWGENMWQAVDHPERYPFTFTSKPITPSARNRYLVVPSKLIRLEMQLEPTTSAPAASSATPTSSSQHSSSNSASSTVCRDAISSAPENSDAETSLVSTASSRSPIMAP